MMETKTIGKFITALRKANGMTQKDLAAKLNVSDKTVSRWERDEGAPDLSMIPVIAEIFGVTCDELLRGERKSPEERAEPRVDNDGTSKGEKQRRRLLKATLSQYRTCTYIAMGVSAIGMIAALIGNLAFLNAVLGFLVGAIFFVAGIVCQVVFMNRAFLSVEDAELEAVELSEFKQTVIRLAKLSIGLTVGFIGFTFPMIMMDAYVGLSADNMFLFGMIGAAVFLLIYAVVLYFLNASLLRQGTYSLNEKDAEVYHHNHRLKKHCAIGLAVLLSITFVWHQIATSIWGPWSIMKGTTFYDYDSFVAYMEQDIPYEPYYEYGNAYSDVEEIASSEPYGEITYYDEYGNEISEEEALHRTLKDQNGNVVCEYIERNEQVCSIHYTAGDDTVLPITVCTYEDLQVARDTVSVRHVLFAIGYCTEILTILLVYFVKRKKCVDSKK